ncbi:MAG: methyltransferase domain-containing protein [Pseudomonadota bacterium]
MQERPERKITPPTDAPAGKRSAAEIVQMHTHRVEKAALWFAEALGRTTPRHCPICGYAGPFSPVRFKLETWCPSCDSRPRHRLMRLWLDRAAAIVPGTRVIHFAAEPWARAWFAAAGAHYRSADLNDRFDLQIDITAMALETGSVDLLIANHVLEHVDDRAALAEIARVLAPGGRALLTVPMIEGWDETYEDRSLVTPEARQAAYGDPDHRRFYGRDLRERIAAAGLALTEFPAVEPDVSRYALNRGERLFIATRP